MAYTFTRTGAQIEEIHNTVDDINDVVGGLTNYQADSVADMIAGVAIGGVVITPELGQTWSSGGIKWRREGIGESISDFSVLSAIVDNEEIGGTTSTAGLGVIGCAVRISPNPSGDNTFDIIDDSEHDPINCVSVSADSNSVNVTHESPLNSNVVGTAIVAPDETLIKRGIMVGGSIATTQSIVTMTKRHSIKLDWTAAASQASDLIVDSFVGSSRYLVGNNIGTTGAFRINHPETLDGVRSVSPLGLDAPDVVVAEVSGNTVDLFPYKTVRITAKRVGGSWVLTGSNSTETAIIALGFTVTDSSNIITINHPTVLSGNAQPQIQWVGVNTYRSPNVLSRGATSCTFTPIDESGNPSPASDGDEFYVTLHEVLWLYGESSLDLGIIELNPLTDFKDIANSNNFWLLGNHWVDK